MNVQYVYIGLVDSPSQFPPHEKLGGPKAMIRVVNNSRHVTWYKGITRDSPDFEYEFKPQKVPTEWLYSGYTGSPAMSHSLMPEESIQVEVPLPPGTDEFVFSIAFAPSRWGPYRAQWSVPFKIHLGRPEAVAVPAD